MSRTVVEWIGRSDDSNPSDACKRRVLDRQGWKCAITGVEFRDGVKPQFDHTTPLWLGGENREQNLQAITKAAHAAKTATEATVRAKVNRLQTKRIGKPKGRGFPKHLKKCMDGTIINRSTGEVVSLYRSADQ